MSNTKKDGDFSLDEELRSKIAANAEGTPIADDHEDNLNQDDNVNEASEEVLKKVKLLRKKYHISQGLKFRPELIDSDVLLSVRNLKQFFFFGSGPSRQKLKAVSNISFDVKQGECFGIVGESGCGKTTTGRSIIKLYDITSGSIYFKGFRISAGERWNRKEIKFTKIRLHQQTKKLREDYNKAVLAIDKNELGPEQYSQKVAALKLELDKKISEIYNFSNKIVSVQRGKIHQIHYDNKHCPRRLVNEIQMIFQDPVDSLDPRMTVEDIIQEGLKIQNYINSPEVVEHVKAIKTEIRKYDKSYELKEQMNAEIKELSSKCAEKQQLKEGKDQIVAKYSPLIAKAKEDYKNNPKRIPLEAELKLYTNTKELYHKRVVEMLEKVGLVAEHASRYPHEFSGGQRQRIGIARALVMNPKLLICDEPISALDVSIRAQIINLLNELKEEMGLTLIFIAHDLSVVKYFCDRIAVMYYGKIVELASSDELFKNPLHPYTRSLLSAIPKPNPLTEKTRERIVYNPALAHDYSNSAPTMKEIKPGHLIYCDDKEFAEYKKILK